MNLQHLSTHKFYKVLLLLIAVGTAVSIKSVFLTFVLLATLIVWDRRFILPLLFFVPLVETIAVATDGVTITKLLSVFIGGYFLIFLNFNKPKIDSNVGLILLFISLTLLATLYGMMGQDSVAASHTSATYFLTVLPKLLFALLLYLYIVKKGVLFLKESMQATVIAMPFILIIVSVYFIWWGFETSNWWNVVTRRTFEGADPNEFGGMMSALTVFPAYLFLNAPNRKFKIVALVAIGFVAYSISLTLSRGAILTFIFMGAAFIALVNKFSFRESIKFAIIVLVSVVLLIQLGVIDLGAIQERFMGRHVAGDLSSLTTGRSTVWLSGIEAFNERPLFGYGNSQNAIFEITSQATGVNKVMHNLYLEILLRMGLVGFISFLALLMRSQIGTIWYLKFGHKKNDFLYILPMVALLTLLFSAFGLSWQWRELLWYFLATSLAFSRLIALK